MSDERIVCLGGPHDGRELKVESEWAGYRVTITDPIGWGSAGVSVYKRTLRQDDEGREVCEFEERRVFA